MYVSRYRVKNSAPQDILYTESMIPLNASAT